MYCRGNETTSSANYRPCNNTGREMLACCKFEITHSIMDSVPATRDTE